MFPNVFGCICLCERDREGRGRLSVGDLFAVSVRLLTAASTCTLHLSVSSPKKGHVVR